MWTRAVVGLGVGVALAGRAIDDRIAHRYDGHIADYVYGPPAPDASTRDLSDLVLGNEP